MLEIYTNIIVIVKEVQCLELVASDAKRFPLNFAFMLENGCIAPGRSMAGGEAWTYKKEVLWMCLDFYLCSAR